MRGGTRDRAQLQCEPFDDFEADGMTIAKELFQVADAAAEVLAPPRAREHLVRLRITKRIADGSAMRFCSET